MEELVTYLKAILAVQVAIYESTEVDQKTEILLARAGVPYNEIAEITGKTYAGVAKAMSRAKKGGRK